MRRAIGEVADWATRARAKPAEVSRVELSYIEYELDELSKYVDELAKEVAPPPKPPPPPEIPIKELAWEKFSFAIKVQGFDPEAYREDFEREYEAVKDRPMEEVQSVMEHLAKAIIAVKPPPPPPPKPPTPDEIAALFLAGRITYNEYVDLMLEYERRKKAALEG